jgi:hypothetical protein
MKRLVQCAVIAALTYVSTPVEAQVLELEGAFVGTGASVGPGFRLGIVLSDRLTLGAGVSAFVHSNALASGSVGSLGGLAGGSGFTGGYAVALPVDLKIWILPANAGSISPTIRLVGTYARQWLGNFGETSSYGGGVLVGATYMVDEVIGISLEAGLEYARSFHESYGFDWEAEFLQVGYRASLVMRI